MPTPSIPHAAAPSIDSVQPTAPPSTQDNSALLTAIQALLDNHTRVIEQKIETSIQESVKQTSNSELKQDIDQLKADNEHILTKMTQWFEMAKGTVNAQATILKDLQSNQKMAASDINYVKIYAHNNHEALERLHLKFERSLQQVKLDMLKELNSVRTVLIQELCAIKGILLAKQIETSNAIQDEMDQLKLIMSQVASTPALAKPQSAPLQDAQLREAVDRIEDAVWSTGQKVLTEIGTSSKTTKEVLEKSSIELKAELDSAFNSISSSLTVITLDIDARLFNEGKKGEEKLDKIAADLSGSIQKAATQITQAHRDDCIQVLQGTRVSLNLPLLRDFDFEGMARSAQDVAAAKRRKRDGTLMAEEFMARRREENRDDPDYEEWSDTSSSIIINAWLSHGNILQNIDSVYPPEEWLKHVERDSLRERILKENLARRENPKKIPSRYIPKPFLYFKRQENKRMSAEGSAAAATTSAGMKEADTEDPDRITRM